MTENEQIRQVLNENPDLPVMLLCDSGIDDEYSTYYHEGLKAYVDSILKPLELERDTGCAWGLDIEMYYTDEDDAVYDVAQWLFDVWCDHAMSQGMANPYYGPDAPDDTLTYFCGFAYEYPDISLGVMSEELARHVVQDMPWQDYVIIRGCL